MLSPEILDTFRTLLTEASAAGDPEPTAMTLATADDDGRVSARIVLLKGVDADGFRFFTNYTSAKGAQIARHPQAALCFHWKTLREGVQVRVEGAVEPLPAADSDAYFATRPRLSQIGAWASLQSQTLPDRAIFEQRVAHYEREFAGRDVPRPPHWGGYRVVPDRVEFWYGAQFRMHERVLWEYVDGRWQRRELYP
ncbi:pyridoxamine 5'-phosphate oxidase [Mizugakiibacter sediminis]|uniref:Pyridoxine/pyridoxamine 5'-phosphate oxidase n=1 Tax=Mizugakiibacter sediminis TaxID=1475481 RepID=A0A0K8QK09_9GAMM|nr:pyridoxamine 5'-phosphate oxidase [Mizugakiibacter sediminis]GAP65144.1 pyridoxamine 5'-phosphate oxidase [Mizugakiibacter sediminis]